MLRIGILLTIGAASLLCAQDGQQGSRPGWPCVAGRAVDPSYLEVSESSGGQLFLFQKSEVAHTSVVMSASYTHPSTVLRAVGNLSGTRDFEFPVDSSMESILVLASLQCRNSIRVTRPNGAELTEANSAQSVDLQAGRILRVDLPEPGRWNVRLTGTGLYVLSVSTKTNVVLSGVAVSPQGLRAHIGGLVSNVKFQAVDASGNLVSELAGAGEPGDEGTYRFNFTPPVERFRILVTGVTSMGWPFQRTHPVLFRATRDK